MSPPPGVLELSCSKCQVSTTCPRNGSSPYFYPNSKRFVLCKLIGGYGRMPLDEAAMSEETKKIRDRDGPCLTIAEVPTLDPNTGITHYETIKIFHKPILHPREKTSEMLDRMYPKSHNQ